MNAADELTAYMSECCLKYLLDSCAVVDEQGLVLRSAGVFIEDAALSKVPAWVDAAQSMSAAMQVQPLSYVCLAGVGQRKHALAWRVSVRDSLVYVVVSLAALPRNMSVIQHDISRDIALLLPHDGGQG